MAQDVLITPASGKIEFKNNTTVSASIVLDAADSNLNLPSGTDVHFQNTTGTAPFIVDSTTKVTNLNADTLDGVSSGSFTRKDGVNNGATTIKVDDADFIVQDSTDGTTNFIWRDHSAGLLYLGTGDAEARMRSDVIVQTISSNANPGTDDLLLNGYGMMGSRATAPVYVTNFGAGGVQIGSGGAHNASNIALFNTAETEIQQGNLKIASGGLTIGSTERIDSTGSFYPQNIQGTSKISFLNGSSALGIRVESLYAGTNYSSDGSGSGYVDTLNGYKVGGTEFIDSDLNIETAGTITSGLSTGDAGQIRTYYSTAGEYAEMTGYGMQFNRSSVYLRPTTDDANTLYIGAADASLDWSAIHFRSTNGLYMTGTQFLTTGRALVNISSVTANTMTIGSDTASNAILKLQEGDVTGDPVWWTVADGGNYSIRLNNIGPYPIHVVTNTGNNAVVSVDIGYKLNVDSTLEVDGAATFNEPAIFIGDADETVVKIIKTFDSADEPGALLIASDADTYDDLAFEIRGNATGGNVDTTTTMTSADTTFAVFANGHTTIGYNNLGTTYTAVGTYGLNVSGGVSTTTGYWLGTTQWMDSSRNLTVGTISSGNTTTSGWLSFGTPGSNSTAGRFLSIEGNADSGGEGSGRIFFTEHNSTTGAMSQYGMSIGYRGGSTSVVGADGNTWTGLADIGNGQWGMWGHDANANGALIMYGDRSATFVNFASNDVQGITDLYIADQVIHTGDTNTYMQFHAADQWRVVTGGGERLEVNNTNTTVANNLIVSGATTLSSQLTADSYILLNKSATATSGAPEQVSEALYLRGSGWDTNNSTARNTDWIIRNEPISNIYPDFDLAFYEEAVSYGHKKFVLHGRGSGSNYQNADSATFYGNVTILKTLDTAGLSGDASGGALNVTDGNINLGDGAEDTRLLIKKADNNVSDHIIFYNGTTRVGEIGVEDGSWLRLNQETAANIYTPRYIRADDGFFVDNTSTGIDASGNFIGGGSVTAGAITGTSLGLGSGAITTTGSISGGSISGTGLTASGTIGNLDTTNDIGQQLEKGTAGITTLRFDSDVWRLYAGGAGGGAEIVRVAEGGVMTIYSTSDAQLQLNGNGTSYAGIGFTDSSGGPDYIWWNGGTETFAIGGGGSGVAGKKLHVDGGVTIGANEDAVAPPTNGLQVEGRIESDGGIQSNANWFGVTTASSRDKYRLYGDSGTYTIGMQSGITYGNLNDWAMTFQFNNETDRGFWWGHTGHSVAQGAMALTTNGNLTVATAGWFGAGESATGNIESGYSLVSQSNIKTYGSLVQEFNTSGGYIARPGGAQYVTQTGSVTGAIKITFPTHGTDDMMSFWVDIYDYSTNESLSMMISGYLYQTTGNNEWVNEEVITLANNANKDFNVRFGADGTKNCVWIGETTSTWSYPQVVVRDFQTGYTSNIDSYRDGWSISFATAFDTVDSIHGTNNFPVASALSESNTQNLVVTKALPKLVLNSANSGDNFTSQGAQISLGESGDGGAAALHLTYTGDGYGRIGMGELAVDGTPPYGEVKWTYNSNIIQIPSAVIEIGSGVRLQESSDRADLLQISSQTSTWGGIQIRNSSGEGRWSFMTDGAIGGIYDDENGDWHIQWDENGGGRYYYNGAERLEITSAGVEVTGTIIATGDIFANTNEQLISGNVTGTLFADVIVANKIETDMLKANTITTAKLAADIITTTQLQISNDGSGAGIFMDGANARIVISDS